MIGHQNLYIYESTIDTIDIELFPEHPFQRLLKNEES